MRHLIDKGIIKQMIEQTEWPNNIIGIGTDLYLSRIKKIYSHFDSRFLNKFILQEKDIFINYQFIFRFPILPKDLQ